MATNPQITGVSIHLPENWFDVDLDAPDAAQWIAGLDLEYTETADQAGFAGALDSIRSKFVADGVDVAALLLPEPNGGVIGAALVLQVLELEPDDTPGSYLEFVGSQRELSTPEFTVSDFQSWRGAHPSGELIGFSHRALLGAGTEASLEERAVFAVFPPGAEEMVKITFRTARPGIFADMAGETGSIVDAMDLELSR